MLEICKILNVGVDKTSQQPVIDHVPLTCFTSYLTDRCGHNFRPPVSGHGGTPTHTQPPTEARRRRGA